MSGIIFPPYRRASSTARYFNADVDCGLVGTWSPFAGYPITMACWFYFQQLGYGTAQTLFVEISRPSGVATNRFGVQGNADFLGVNATAATGEAATQQDQILHGDNKWQHVGGVFGSNTSRKSYHNGRFVAEETTNVPVDFSLLTNITIGQGNSLFGGAKHHGGIAEAAFWACELSTSEFGALALGESPLRIRPQKLVAYYPLDEGRGPALNRAPATQGRYTLFERTAQQTKAVQFPVRINQGARRRIYVPSAAAGVTFEQEGFRWRYDDGDEDGATFSAAQDEPSAASIGITKRLRLLVDVTGNPGSPAAEQFQLQYRRTGSPTEDWKKVN